MSLINAFIMIIFGVFFIFFGSLQMICYFMPSDMKDKVAIESGKWTRKHVFRLPPLEDK